MPIGVGDGGKNAGLLGSVDDQAEGVWGVLGLLLSVEVGVEPSVMKLQSTDMGMQWQLMHLILKQKCQKWNSRIKDEFRIWIGQQLLKLLDFESGPILGACGWPGVPQNVSVLERDVQLSTITTNMMAVAHQGHFLMKTLFCMCFPCQNTRRCSIRWYPSALSMWEVFRGNTRSCCQCYQ